MGMKAAVMMSDSRGTHSTSWTGAFRFRAMVGSINDIIPVSSGGTKLPMFTAARENHLRRFASASTSRAADVASFKTVPSAFVRLRERRTEIATVGQSNLKEAR